MEALAVVVLGVVLCVIIGVIAQEFIQSLLEPLRWWLTRVASREPRTPEQVSCSIRAIEGTPHGFSRTWISGVASLHPGVVRFAAGGAETAIAVTAVGPLAADTSRGTIRSARVRLSTDEGPLEISMQRGVIERMRQVVVAPRR